MFQLNGTSFRKRPWRYLVCLLIMLVFATCMIFLQSSLKAKRYSTLQDIESKFEQKIATCDDITNETQTCIHPTLPLWTDTIRVGGVYSPCQPIQCNSDDNWVYTANGRFYISDAAVRSHGQITCSYYPVIFENDPSNRILYKISLMLNNTLLVSDAFKVACKAIDGAKYNNVHVGIAPNTTRQHNISTEYIRKDINYNVLMFGLDSLSRKAFERFLPRSLKYFTSVMGGISLDGYNLVGDGTARALLPILTGKGEMSLPEVRRGFSVAQHMDEAVEFIWKKFEKRGYITSYSEDFDRFGTFNFKLSGFKSQPVFHYARPFYIETKFFLPHFPRFCLGSKPVHNVMLDWIKEGFITNKDIPLFTFGFFGAYSHNNNDCTSLADSDIEEMFRFLKETKVLANTFVIFMSDHGLRVGDIRLTEQGKLEERMPYFGIYIPENYKRKYPYKYKNLLVNSKRLTTPFDIHETFLDILSEGLLEQSSSDRSSYSLLTEIPLNRTCASAGIEPHWCACLGSKYVPVTDSVVVNSANRFVNNINTIMSMYGPMCSELSLKRILKSYLLQSDEDLFKLKMSAHKTSQPDTIANDIVFYQITIETEPGGGLFEATTSYNVKTGSIGVDLNAVSRLNLCGDSPKCLADKMPSLYYYCVCK